MTGKPQQQSIFYHVPLDLLRQLQKFRTKNSAWKIRYKYRQPIKGVIYSPFGGLSKKQARSVSIYVEQKIPHYFYPHDYFDMKRELSKLRALNTLWVVRWYRWIASRWNRITRKK